MYFEAKPPKLGEILVSRGQGAWGRVAEGYILDLIEHHTAGLVDAEETDDGSEDRHAEHDLVVGDRQEKDIVVVDTFGCIIVRLPCLYPGLHMVLFGEGRRWPRRLRLRAN